MTLDVRTAYLAPAGFQVQLERELKGIVKKHGRLVLTDQPVQDVLWAQNVWQNPQVFEIESINDAARKLKNMQRNWCLYSVENHRRSKLIQDKLPYVAGRALKFPSLPPEAPLGSWTLLDKNTLLASGQCSSAFPNGEVHFIEDKKGPPSRAYLKLWEALTLMGAWPKKDEFCVDLGGCPGGWAWTCAKLGAKVVSVDRTALTEQVMRNKKVEFRKGNAFSIKPDDFEKVDWLFWDVACEPEKLFGYIGQWVKSIKAGNIICTLKFQGETDYAIAWEFLNFKGSTVRHLFHNKHELTWMWQVKQ